MSKEELQPEQNLPASKITESSHAPSGTYECLESILDSDENTRLFNTIRHKTFIRVARERVCKETGGSCMDLLLRLRTGVGELTWHHAHVTQDNRIVRQISSIENQEGEKEVSPTSLEEMMKTLNGVLSNPNTQVTSYRSG